ncbi:MAG: hypothetical protein OIF57_06735 [Marinobacterium sp.]|nr:hypothetical protein [Marinobacterium sp.]
MIPNTVTNAPNIIVLETLDHNYTTGGGEVSVFGTVIEARKGLPGVPHRLTAPEVERTFGKAFPLKMGAHAEGLRHVAEAAAEAQKVVVVRVVAADARVPSISLMNDGSVVKGQHDFDDQIIAGNGTQLVLYPKDGDDSKGREITFSWNADKQRAVIEVWEKDRTNEFDRVERHVVGFDVDDRDDMGRPAYIEAVFKTQSSRLAVDAAPEVDLSALPATLETAGKQRIAFEGGTGGGRPTTDDYVKAWNVFRNMSVEVNELFAAGCYDTTVIANATEIANGRHIEFRFDIPPYLDQGGAVQWQKDAGIQSRQASAYWAPYKAKDPVYNVDGVWGVSGAACGAKAKGNRLFTGDVPGIHYTPAGAKRGTINRRDVVALFPRTPIDGELLTDNRINPIVPNSSGPGVVINDALTCHYLDNYSRFNWVTAIDNYIVHRFIAAASLAKFEPDGLTEKVLRDLMQEIRDDLIISGAIVKPREPEDGDDPMVIEITQLEIDLWQVVWSYCPTGSARRIVGQPKIVR